MGDTEDKPYSWTVNFIGTEGFREYLRVESSDAVDLANRRAAILKTLLDIGAVPDVRKLFDDNGTKPGKLQQSGPTTGEGTGEGTAKPSKLAKYGQTEQPKTEQNPDEAIAAMRDSGFLDDKQADAVSESLGVAVPPKAPKEAEAPAKPSKLAKFAPKPAAAPAPKPTQDGPALAPNVSPKLSRFVKPEQKKD